MNANRSNTPPNLRPYCRSIASAVTSLGLLAVSVTPTQAATVTQIQSDWANAMYATASEKKEIQLSSLAETAHRLVLERPGRAEPLIWEGIVLSSLAGAKGGLSALSLVHQARERFDAAIVIDRKALNGSALGSLGVLFHKVPGWPLGFGNDNRAEELLLEALKVTSTSIDTNYFYGEFLSDEGRPGEALIFLQRAIDAPARPGRELADQGRRGEARALLAKTKNQN